MEKYAKIDKFCLYLKRKKFGTFFGRAQERQNLNQILIGTFDPAKMAHETLEHLAGCVKSPLWKDLVELFVNLRRIGKIIIKASPMQLSIANMVKRVLHIVREVAKSNEVPLPAGDEYQLVVDKKEEMPIESLYDIIKATPAKPKEEAQPVVTELKERLEKQRNSHKQEVLQQIEELMVEMDSMRQSILEQAKEYILPNDVILTYDLSLTLVEFFAVTCFCFSAGKPKNPTGGS